MTPSRADREAAERVARVARRAIWRLDVLEWLIVVGALGIAVLGGGGVAWLIAPSLGLEVRPVWVVVSLLLFVVPGGWAIVQAKRAERDSGLREPEHREEDDG